MTPNLTIERWYQSLLRSLWRVTAFGSEPRAHELRSLRDGISAEHSQVNASALCGLPRAFRGD